MSGKRAYLSLSTLHGWESSQFFPVKRTGAERRPRGPRHLGTLGRCPAHSEPRGRPQACTAPAAGTARCSGLGMEGTQSGGAVRFSCPRNFTAIRSASEPSRLSLETLTGPDTELWLIQAPADFAPDCLNGRLVPLSGSHIVKGKLAGKRHRYQVLGTSDPLAGEATLLAPSAQAGGGLTCAPAPQGSLRIIEGPQEPLSGLPLQPIPTSPPPQIPPGLRPRFCAFGGSPPVTGPGSPLALKSPSSGKRKKRQVPEGCTAQVAVNGHAVPEVETEMDVGKKKKKRKHQLEEPGLMEPAGTEPRSEMSEPLGVLVPPTSKKHKRQPKEAETVQPTERTAELDSVAKTESPKEAALSPTKKRKRQTEVEGMQLEGVTVQSQPQVTGELQEEAIPAKKKKKKKKEKRPEVTMEPGTEAVEPGVRSLAPHGQIMEPELPQEVEPQYEATLESTKKRKKKEKRQNVMLEPGAEVVEPEPPGDLEPQAALASTKKKKDREQKVGEPRTELSDPPREAGEPEQPGKGEPHAGAALGSTRKKRKRGEENRVPESAEEMPEIAPPEGMPEIDPPEDIPELPLNLETREVAPAEKKKKRKQQPQLDPV
ncbi:PREDICTED: DNA-directed RNA polymerase I subunit RPA34 isoform X2 [Chinchilla lanigera]|uniref:DNA-directed RNA polymerase I subunit RPA34 n=1 Tax=Chinchilla lanigera TaxID=34839 RepID=A0A8C2UZQ8_CHILA|nr:PREDICTED: DNA-directed RNA polymerase I subunit RPA34 isoform X2 [Chinchilla lanigera]